MPVVVLAQRARRCGGHGVAHLPPVTALGVAPDPPLLQYPHPLLVPTFPGPYASNGVPLRRINQAYAIATSTTVDVSKVDLKDIGDAQFAAKEEKALKKKGLPAVPKDKATGKTNAADEAAFFAAAKALKGQTSDASKALQARVDGAIKLDATLSAYLKARFALSKGQRPHEMKW